MQAARGEFRGELAKLFGGERSSLVATGFRLNRLWCSCRVSNIPEVCRSTDISNMQTTDPKEKIDKYFGFVVRACSFMCFRVLEIGFSSCIFSVSVCLVSGIFCCLDGNIYLLACP